MLLNATEGQQGPVIEAAGNQYRSPYEFMITEQFVNIDVNQEQSQK